MFLRQTHYTLFRVKSASNPRFPRLNFSKFQLDNLAGNFAVSPDLTFEQFKINRPTWDAVCIIKKTFMRPKKHPTRTVYLLKKPGRLLPNLLQLFTMMVIFTLLGSAITVFIPKAVNMLLESQSFTWKTVGILARSFLVWLSRLVLRCISAA